MNVKNVRTRVLSMILVLCMVIGMMPMGVFAEEIDALADTPASGNGYLVGGKVYTLDTNGVTANKNYLIVNTSSNGNGYALTNEDGSAGRTQVAISNSTITVDDDTDIAWTFSGSTSGTVGNNGRFVYPNNGSLSLNTNGTNMTISDQDDGEYRIYRSGRQNNTTYYYYPTYNSNSWTGARTSRTNSIGSVYLYELTSSSSGEAVTFTVTPGSATLKPDDTLDLIGTVTVAGETVDLDDCTIDWTSNKDSVATVSDDGVVTGVTDGEANIVATLSAVDGTALQEKIVLTIRVIVQSKKLDTSYVPVLTGNDPITINVGGTPDFSGIQLEVKYEGDEDTTIITVENGLVIEEYDNSTVGSDYLDISFGGKVYGTVRLTVKGDPYAGKVDATTYPEYPADGAVRIDKNAYEEDFKNTGVVRVELDVAGVSVKSAVDVILVADISNSMAWKAGERNVSPDEGETTKWQDLQAAAGSFIDTLLKPNDDGTATSNTVSFVTFGGYDKERNNNASDYTDYFDATQTVFIGSSNAVNAKSQINAYDIQGNDTDGYTMEINGTSAGAPQGGTNYDHAFQETAVAINQLKANYAANNNGASYDESGRQIYVVFMTDGAPDHYNQLYYKTRTSSQFDYYALYKNDTDIIGNYFDPEDPDLPSFGSLTFTQHQKPNGYYMAGVSNANWITWIQQDSLYAAEQVLAMENVHSITSIGFDLENGAFGTNWSFGLDVLENVLTNLAGENSCEVFTTADKTELDAFYEKLATKIRYAGTQANVTDVVDNDFNLQLTQTTGTADATTNGDLGFMPTITIKTYDLWTKEETSDTTLIGTRKGTFSPIETVTFNEAGTEAYSNLKSGNIMSTAADGTVTIEAFYFTYTRTSDSVETFEWNIGNITDKEIALSYYAYLIGTLEGTRPKGLYYTNEEATLEYLDINDKHATKTFPIPAVAWGGASTAYEFYLVNENGEPCDRNGTVVPFANRIIITGPYYEELYLNQEDEEKAKEIVAAYVLPAGYTLYDDTAKYTVVTASGTKAGSLEISAPAEGKAQTTIVVSATEPSYIQSRVAFGVIYNDIPEVADFALTPDKVVIDYGKEIVINIANGNDDLEDGYTAKLVGFSKYYANVDMKHKFSNTAYVDDFPATYGIFSVENDGTGEDAESTVRYKPTGIVNDVEMVFCVIEMYNATKNDTYYMVDWLTVIPATSVYYETDFATGVFETVTTATAEADVWQTIDDASSEEDGDDDTQDDGTIGKNQTYGYDSTYDDDAYLSDGDSLFVKGQGYDTTNNNAAKTYTTFSFKGTGFDLISRTGVEQGLIKVEVYSDAAMTQIEKTVSVLNKSESSLELYQIPVVSIEVEYGIHYVRVSVDQKYESSIPALSALKRGDEFYFDAIRVFDPALGNAVAEDAYAADGEANRRLAEVRNMLISADDFNALTEGQSTDGAVYVDRTNSEEGEDITVEDHNTLSVATYAKVGPNNEVYLSNGQAVAFKVGVPSAPASFDLGAKSITGAAANLKVTITNGTKSWTVTEAIASSTAQNINLLTDDADPSIFTSGATVVITNTGSGVLSITDLKAAFSTNGGANDNPEMENLSAVDTASVMTLAAEAEDNDPYAVSYTVDAGTFALARAVLLAADAPEEEIPEETEPEETEPEVTEPEETEPEVTEPEAEPNYDILDASIKTTTGKNKKTVITVETTQDVVELKIREGKKSVKISSIDYEDQEDGTRVWTIVLSNSNNGNKTYTITGYGEDGTSGRSASVSNKNNKNDKKNNKR